MKARAEQFPVLDVRKLQRERVLAPGTMAKSRPVNGACIAIEAEPAGVWLTIENGQWRQWVPLVRTSCTYGGGRPWFLCPHCLARVAVLYLRSGFRCRTCAQVNYSSQAEDGIARAMRCKLKIERRLCADGERPKGMHWRTFERLRAALDGCDARADAALGAVVGRLFPVLIEPPK